MAMQTGPVLLALRPTQTALGLGLTHDPQPFNQSLFIQHLSNNTGIGLFRLESMGINCTIRRDQN